MLSNGIIYTGKKNKVKRYQVTFSKQHNFSEETEVKLKAKVKSKSLCIILHSSTSPSQYLIVNPNLRSEKK